VSEKYTSAPEVALQVVSIIRASLIEAHLASSSPGGSVRRAEDAAEGEAPRAPPARLHQRYGNALPDVLRHAQGRPELMRPLAPGCEVLRVEVVHAIRGEMALTLHDVVLRRVGLAGGGPPDPASLRACAQYAGEAACWNPDHIRSAVASLEAGWPHLSTADEPLFPQG
jgi:glycerol-3-phosphate dehydrogenase